MCKQTYLAILMRQSPDWIIGSMRNPSPSMRSIHVALHAIALRRLGAPSDACGNPRYVVHFLNLNTREELDRTGPDWIGIDEKYRLACKRANSIGGRRYRTKRYGGGIVFQSYSIDETAAHISRVTGRQFVAVEG